MYKRQECGNIVSVSLQVQYQTSFNIVIRCMALDWYFARTVWATGLLNALELSRCAPFRLWSLILLASRLNFSCTTTIQKRCKSTFRKLRISLRLFSRVIGIALCGFVKSDNYKLLCVCEGRLLLLVTFIGAVLMYLCMQGMVFMVYYNTVCWIIVNLKSRLCKRLYCFVYLRGVSNQFFVKNSKL